MPTITPGKTWVETPPPLQPRPYGLFSAADFTEGAGSWQIRGTEYFTDACAQGGHVVGSCPQPAPDNGPDATTHDKPTAEGLNLGESSQPFTVYARAECNAVGFDDPQGLALTRLGLIEEREAERYFSVGLLGVNDPEHTPRFPLGAAAAPVPLAQALGALEGDAAAAYAGTPTLHAPRWTAPYWEPPRLLQPNADTGPVRRTHLSSRVTFGLYLDDPFDTEAAPAPGTFWLVATGTVRGWRSTPFVNETFTPATNTRMAIAERTYVLDSDCYRAAVLVTVTPEAT